MSDSRVAATLAAQAGQLLLQVRHTSAGLLPQKLGERGDALSNELLLRELAEHRPGDAVLSEESADNPVRLGSARVWIIDPLDGSREFGLPGRADWAVHVALWETGSGITAAAVAQPALDAVYSDGDRPPTLGPVGVRPRILVSERRPPEFTEALAGEIGADIATMGSAGAKTMAILRGGADAYVHAGGQWEWDSAAPVGVALAAGLHASRIDGAPLRYNQAHPYLPDLLICRAELAAPMLAALDRCVPASSGPECSDGLC